MRISFLRFLHNYTTPLKKAFLYLLLFSALLSACSSERNTWTSKAFHNTTAHYNGYWYAKEELKKIEAAIKEGHVDDYNRVLRVFPTFDSTLGTTFEKELAEAVKMASIAIQRHPNSKWVDDAYIQVGKARFYSMDFGNAIQTFKYTNKISKNADTKHSAIINLIRVYIEHGEFNNAQAAIDHLLKQDLNKENKKRLFLERAYYYQLQDDLDNMVRNLTQASPMLKKSDSRGRVFFIIGQVYQRLGFEAEAFNFYKRCLATNPEYEVEFYARLYMAQVTEISKNKDINSARKSFRKLLKDKKNKEFKDKIYYEWGVFEFKQNKIAEAIEKYNQSVREGNNKKIDGEAYLRLGEIYYDTLKDYELSQAYYDSAINSLPNDYENYEQIKARQQILNEFVQQLKTIQWQDSLLHLARLDSADLMAMVDSVVTERLKQEEELKKKTRNRISIATNDNSNLFDSDDGGSQNEDATWYFGNPTTMGIGQAEFVRVWGNIALADDWRRSQREQARANVAQSSDGGSLEAGNQSTEQGEAGAEEADPVAIEFSKLDQEIPRTEEAKQAALTKIEDAYFKLGGIYHFKLLESNNAVSTYQTLLRRFPETAYEPEVLYTLYIILKETDSLKAADYASMLLQKHPKSTFAKILINPDYLQESNLAAEKQKSLYKKAYAFFEEEEYDSALATISDGYALGETDFIPNLKLLEILITGKTEDISQYQYELDEFSKNYPNTETATYALKLLESSRKLQTEIEKRRGIQFIPAFNEPHYFVIIYRQRGKDEVLSSVLEQFNKKHFGNLRLHTSNLVFSEDYFITFVTELQSPAKAYEYYKVFNQNVSDIRELRNLKFDNFVITKDNFDIFYRTKGLDEYIRFFEKNYPVKNQ